MKRNLFVTLMLVFALSFSLIAFTGCALGDSGSQVPVYEGMTVSSEAPTVSREASAAVRYSLASGVLVDEDSPILTETVPFDKALADHFGKTDGKYNYYANKNEDVYITVHINNPGGFEILSFTLNGVKYTSYMFEDGSDLENLVLKVNVGDVETAAVYTIDAIKYVDGESIKDVKMEGDRTVEIGISKAVQPSASMEIKGAKLNGAEINVSVTDAEDAVKLGEGKIYALVYDGSSIVVKKELSVGENKGITFVELKPKGTYKLAVVAVYDAFDGKGVSAHVLTEKTISLDPAVTVAEASVVRNRVYFSLSLINDFSTVSKVELVDLLGNTVDTMTPDSFEDLYFSGLKAGEYTLRVSYSYEGATGLVTETSESEAFVCIVGASLIDGGKIIRTYSNGFPAFDPTTGENRVHNAVDVAPTGSDKSVKAISGGVVSAVGCDVLLGNFVYVVDRAGYTYHYCSLDEILVEVGAEVACGDVVGTAGISYIGESLAGDHVHFFLKDAEGNEVDPYIYDLPVSGSVINSYSDGETPHLGVDIAPSGANNAVHSITTGVVSEIGENEEYGKYIAITDVYGYTYFYCSLDNIHAYQVGFDVLPKEELGSVGDSMASESDLGTHLHLFLKDPDGKIVDPGF